MLYLGLVVLALFAIFIWWRLTSVARGAAKRDQSILALVDPLAEKLNEGRPVAAQEIATVAEQPQTRPFLYEMLKHFEQLELFPEDLKSREAQGEAMLTYWMMHPNELEAPPAEMELVQTCQRRIEDRKADFLVFRYRMEPGHWAGEDWLLGLSGPFFENDVPYSGIAGAFSRASDKYGEVPPDELVDWFIDMVNAKTGR